MQVFRVFFIVHITSIAKAQTSQLKTNGVFAVLSLRMSKLRIDCFLLCVRYVSQATVAITYCGYNILGSPVLKQDADNADVTSHDSIVGVVNVLHQIV